MLCGERRKNLRDKYSSLLLFVFFNLYEFGISIVSVLPTCLLIDESSEKSCKRFSIQEVEATEYVVEGGKNDARMPLSHVRTKYGVVIVPQRSKFLNSGFSPRSNPAPSIILWVTC
jgi:hypothetical protein